MPMYEKHDFTDFRSFNLAMQDWALEGETKFTYRYKTSDATPNTDVCVHDDCPFRASAIYSASIECVVVISLDS